MPRLAISVAKIMLGIRIRKEKEEKKHIGIGGCVFGGWGCFFGGRIRKIWNLIQNIETSHLSVLLISLTLGV